MITSAVARDPKISYELPPGVLMDPEAAEAWIMSLPPGPRATLQARLTAIYKGMPPAAQFAIQRALIAAGHIPPVQPSLDGVRGLGQWGTLVGALVQVGAGLYNNKQMMNLQEEMQSNSLAQNAQIAAAQLEAQKEAQLALIDAQTQAAKIAAAAGVQAGSVYSAATTARMPYYILGGVAVLGLGAFMYFKLRKKAK
jgi:hypothetical protein